MVLRSNKNDSDDEEGLSSEGDSYRNEKRHHHAKNIETKGERDKWWENDNRGRYTEGVSSSSAGKGKESGNEDYTLEVEDDDARISIGPEDYFWFNQCSPFSPVLLVFWLFWVVLGTPLFILRLLLLLTSLAVASLSTKLCGNCRLGLLKIWFSYVVFPFCGLLISVKNRDLLHAHQAQRSPTIVCIAAHTTNIDPLFAALGGLLHEFTLVGDGAKYGDFWLKLKEFGFFKDIILTNPFASPEKRQQTRNEINEWHLKHEMPLVLYPEGCVTGLGPAGLIRFEKFAFGLHDVTVVPVALRARFPWGMRTYIFHSSPHINFLCYLFMPFITLEHTVLEGQRMQEGEDDEKFARS